MLLCESPNQRFDTAPNRVQVLSRSMLLRARGGQYIDVSAFHAQYDQSCSRFLRHIPSIRHDLGEKLNIFAVSANLWWSSWLALPTERARRSLVKAVFELITHLKGDEPGVYANAKESCEETRVMTSNACSEQKQWKWAVRTSSAVNWGHLQEPANIVGIICS